jgi:5-methylthioadenosine/S-adenosylhomocysteine deaminase
MTTFDLIVTNGTILTFDPENRVIENGVLGISGNTISYLGEPTGQEHDALKTIDAKGGLILPGLINGHTHSPMSLFKGLADDLPLMKWLNRYIFPVEQKMDEDFIRTGSLLACAEMILSGTTTFCDMYLFEDQVAQAAFQSGLRCIVGEVLYDFPSPNYGELENGFAYTEWLIEKWKDNPLVSIAVEPHALFTCSPELLQRANEMALSHQTPLIIHFAETLAEVEEIQKRYGKTPLEHLEDLGIAGPHLIADHAVHLNTSEIAKMAEYGIKVVHNPESNMKLSSGVAPVPQMIRQGLTVGMGTDGSASNNNMDLFTEMDMAAKLHKVKTMDPTVMDALTVLKMATIEGARALGMGQSLGSLEKGKKADIIVIDTRKPHLTPMYNPFSHLVYAARGQDVSHTIINGRLVMENRQLLTLDLQEVMARSKEKAADVRKWVSSQ